MNKRGQTCVFAETAVYSGFDQDLPYTICSPRPRAVIRPLCPLASFWSLDALGPYSKTSKRRLLENESDVVTKKIAAMKLDNYIEADDDAFRLRLPQSPQSLAVEINECRYGKASSSLLDVAKKNVRKSKNPCFVSSAPLRPQILSLSSSDEFIRSDSEISEEDYMFNMGWKSPVQTKRTKKNRFRGMQKAFNDKGNFNKSFHGIEATRSETQYAMTMDSSHIKPNTKFEDEEHFKFFGRELSYSSSIDSISSKVELMTLSEKNISLMGDGGGN